ncbi:MAG: purine phosphoribosyltransferase family protein [Myxococcota bacterium]
MLENSEAFRQVIDLLAQRYKEAGITRVAGIESRGFIFGSALAYAMECGFTLIRKPGKLPRPTHSARYCLEYGEDAVHVHQDSVIAIDRVVVIDDVIAQEVQRVPRLS